MPGPAQTPATLNDVRTVSRALRPAAASNRASRCGTASDRILVSWSQCRVLDVTGPDPTRIIPCDAQNVADPATVSRATDLQRVDVQSVAEHHPADHRAGRRRHGHRGHRRAAAQPVAPVIVDRKPPDLNADLGRRRSRASGPTARSTGARTRTTSGDGATRRCRRLPPSGATTRRAGGSATRVRSKSRSGRPAGRRPCPIATATRT